MKITTPIDTTPAIDSDRAVIACYDRAAMIDWTNCPDVERTPGKCSGAWCVKGTRVMVESCILGNAEDCSAEEVADMFGLPVEIVRRILAFAGVTALDYSEIPPLDDEFFSTAKRPGKPLTDDEIRRAMRYVLCQSCGTLHLGTPAATTDLCANCQGSEFHLSSVEMVTQPIPSVRWPRPYKGSARS